MVIKKAAIEKIRRIIDKHHKYLLLTMLGKKNVPPEILAELKAAGFNVDYQRSFLEMAYHHNAMNPHGAANAPRSAQEASAQQSGALPQGPVQAASTEFLNSNLQNLIEKQKAEVSSRIEGLIQGKNNEFKFDALKNPGRPEALDEMVRDTTVGELKQALRDASKDAARNWRRVVNTEVSNAVSLGSADRIVSENREKPAEDVYVYRIVVNDSALCKYCRKFYLDEDGTPKVYRLSEILGNGSNFGRKSSQWKPTALATHPNERCSQIIELKPGWKVLNGGGQTFIGVDAWTDYIFDKVSG